MEEVVETQEVIMPSSLKKINSIEKSKNTSKLSQDYLNVKLDRKMDSIKKENRKVKMKGRAAKAIQPFRESAHWMARIAPCRFLDTWSWLCHVSPYEWWNKTRESKKLEDLCLILHIKAQILPKVYIVYMGNIIHQTSELVEASHHEILTNLLGSKEVAQESILYSYKHGFSGFSAVLTESQAKQIAGFPEVISVFPNRMLKLHTTRSWDFLHVKSQLTNGILRKSNFGAGVIIGFLDTGIWPESESFVDNGIEEVPSTRWNGLCQEGENFNRSSCNRKIIGARWYIKGYEAENGKFDPKKFGDFLSARDTQGHGTHTASTAAGRLTQNVSVGGLAGGFARGGAPLAWISSYKTCWGPGACASADLLAAFDGAIFDGVDVLSLSLGDELPPFPTYVEDVLAIGSFHANAKGISVVCSAGNSGPLPHTVANTFPWVLTTAASTIDRVFPTSITMGNNKTVLGQALNIRNITSKFYRLMCGKDITINDAADDVDGRSCQLGSLNATLVSGNIILCFQSGNDLLTSADIAFRSVRSANGAGVIFARAPTDLTIEFLRNFIQVDFGTGSILQQYSRMPSPMVQISYPKTTVGKKTSPKVAIFSSRGPNSVTPYALKPDIAAPGVNILAAWSPAAGGNLFNVESGTSMSTPHVAGIVALLKAIHPSWSPAAIKSALVTTASHKDIYGQRPISEGLPNKLADLFDYGGGLINPNQAMDPGLIYEVEASDYIKFLCSMGYSEKDIGRMANIQNPCNDETNFLINLNLPSISIPELKNSITISRTVTNVGPVNSIYIARVQVPSGIFVKVQPSILFFNSTKEQQEFKVTFYSLQKIQGEYAFGYLFWEDFTHQVKTPLFVQQIIDY
ncbi:subtilisin-like protease SBT3.5 [Malania oleifera]|uniref:subtilisin-like protease SBT3.5 n=1 Tax=Malania oleifera TaxID=397392 RepID=UPI0025AEAC64|nr:subtilisin-like protease SBT3.5 [Malania oleifera]